MFGNVPSIRQSTCPDKSARLPDGIKMTRCALYVKLTPAAQLQNHPERKTGTYVVGPEDQARTIPYSCRSADIGSIFAARNAGTAQASLLSLKFIDKIWRHWPESHQPFWST